MRDGVTLALVGEQQAVLAAAVAELDPDVVLASEAPAMWQAFDRIERLAASAKTLLARRVEDSHVWRRQGHKSPAEYLAAKAGTTMGRARDELETSKRLGRQPVLSEACRRGEVSPAQAAAVSAATQADPAAESRLVSKAMLSTVADLRDECARTRAAADPNPDATHRRIHQARSLRRFTGPDGTWNLMARGTVDDGARINAALDPVLDEIFTTARSEGRREPHDAYAFDALVELAERAKRPRSEATNETRRPRPRHLALVRVDLEALRRGAVAGDERCEITGLGPIPVKVARRLLGDSILKLVVTRGVDVLNVTHLGRGPTAAQRIALLWASPQCTTELCHRTRVEIDHRIPWAETRHTRLDELDPLCKHCHDLKTHQDWALTTGTGRRPLVPPDDPRHPANSPPPSRASPAAGAPTGPEANASRVNPLFPEAC